MDFYIFYLRHYKGTDENIVYKQRQLYKEYEK